MLRKSKGAAQVGAARLAGETEARRSQSLQPPGRAPGTAHIKPNTCGSDRAPQQTKKKCGKAKNTGKATHKQTLSPLLFFFSSSKID